jgi:hypothetical protein
VHRQVDRAAERSQFDSIEMVALSERRGLVEQKPGTTHGGDGAAVRHVGKRISRRSRVGHEEHKQQ